LDPKYDVYSYGKKGKVKVVPLRSLEAHLGERRYSFYSFLTSALEGGEWSASRPGRALPPGKEPPVPIVQEAGWAPEPVWTQRLEEELSASVGDRTPAVQFVVIHYTELTEENQNKFGCLRKEIPTVGLPEYEPYVVTSTQSAWLGWKTRSIIKLFTVYYYCDATS
jgi:hypothetical protein